MDFFNVIQSRHSVRKYQVRDVEQEKLNRILEAMNLAPSAGNLQGYEIIAVRDSSTKLALAEASYGQHFITQAPVALVLCADHLRSAGKYAVRGSELYAVQDATIAATYCQLAATALGLGTAWIGAFDTDAVATAIEAPQDITPVAIILIGYPDGAQSAKPRRKLADLVRIEKF